MKTFRIGFMGTPDFAVPTLEALLNSPFKVDFVITQPDRPAGRSMKVQPSPVKVVATKAGIEVFQPEKIRNNEEIHQLVRDRKPDLIVVVAFGQILPGTFINIPPYGCLNLHASLLPKYRGAAPINWAIINGETISGLTVMVIDEGMDTGPILSQEAYPIDPEETALDVEKRFSVYGAKLMIKTIEEWLKGMIEPKSQDHSQATYAPRLKKEDGLVDWSRPAQEIINRIRGFYPWPMAYSYLKGMRICFHKARVYDHLKETEPGVITNLLRNQGILVSTGDGHILLEIVHPECRKPMSAWNLCCGYKIELGDRFNDLPL